MKDRHINRHPTNFVDLSNSKIGKLTVVCDTGRRKSRRPIWKCICECGKEIEVLSKYLLNGDTKSCGCITQGNAHNRDCVGKITKSFWTPIVKQAHRRGIPFEITREEAWNLFTNQGRKCKLTGLDITFSSNIRDQCGKQTTSLDRIDSTKGYTLGNVQWVHKTINIMKNTLSNDKFLEWCELVVKFPREGS